MSCIIFTGLEPVVLATNSIRLKQPQLPDDPEPEDAACEANATARPFGRYGPTPEEVWRQRVPVGEEERNRFQQTYRRRYAEECSRRGLPWTTAIETMEKASIDRVAISRALVEHGYLGFRRKRITTPIPPKKEANKR